MARMPRRFDKRFPEQLFVHCEGLRAKHAVLFSGGAVRRGHQRCPKQQKRTYLHEVTSRLDI